MNKPKKAFDKSYYLDSDGFKNRLQKENIDFVKLLLRITLLMYSSASAKCIPDF
jgi:hypothetical protein